MIVELHIAQVNQGKAWQVKCKQVDRNRILVRELGESTAENKDKAILIAKYRVQSLANHIHGDGIEWREVDLTKPEEPEQEPLGRRVKIVRVCWRDVLSALRHDWKRQDYITLVDGIADLPNGYEVLAAQVAPFGSLWIDVLVSHPSFDPVPDGSMPPLFDGGVRRLVSVKLKRVDRITYNGQRDAIIEAEVPPDYSEAKCDSDALTVRELDKPRDSATVTETENEQGCMQ